MVTTKEVDSRYLKLEKQGNIMEIKNELYSDDIVCIEPAHAATTGMH